MPACAGPASVGLPGASQLGRGPIFPPQTLSSPHPAQQADGLVGTCPCPYTPQPAWGALPLLPPKPYVVGAEGHGVAWSSGRCPLVAARGAATRRGGGGVLATPSTHTTTGIPKDPGSESCSSAAKAWLSSDQAVIHARHGEVWPSSAAIIRLQSQRAQWCEFGQAA